MRKLMTPAFCLGLVALISTTAKAQGGSGGGMMGGMGGMMGPALLPTRASRKS